MSDPEHVDGSVIGIRYPPKGFDHPQVRDLGSFRRPASQFVHRFGYTPNDVGLIIVKFSSQLVQTTGGPEAGR